MKINVETNECVINCASGIGGGYIPCKSLSIASSAISSEAAVTNAICISLLRAKRSTSSNATAARPPAVEAVWIDRFACSLPASIRPKLPLHVRFFNSIVINFDLQFSSIGNQINTYIRSISKMLRMSVWHVFCR